MRDFLSQRLYLSLHFADFTRKGFDVYVHYATWASIYLAAAALGLEILKALYR